MSTGFHAYWIYCTIKHIHFKSDKYSIVNQRLPRREQFVRTWNEGRKDRDGLLFLKLFKNIPFKKEHYIRCFAYYYMQNPAFHVSDILNDNFQLYKKYELELDNIEQTVKSDYLTAALYSAERDVPMQDMFYGAGTGLPFIFTLYDRGKISIHSMIAFDLVFHLRARVRDGLLDDIDIVRQDKCKNYAVIFDKYAEIVYNYYTSIDWKELLQTYHYEIMKLGPNA